MWSPEVMVAAMARDITGFTRWLCCSRI